VHVVKFVQNNMTSPKIPITLTNKRTPSLNDGRFPTKRFVQRDNGLIRPQTYNMESDAHLPMNTHHQFITNSPILSE